MEAVSWLVGALRSDPEFRRGSSLFDRNNLVQRVTALLNDFGVSMPVWGKPLLDAAAADDVRNRNPLCRR